jgi:hypothetical protein
MTDVGTGISEVLCLSFSCFDYQFLTPSFHNAQITVVLEQMKLKLTSTQLEIAMLQHEVAGLGRDVLGVWGDVGELHELLTGDSVQ